MHELLLIQRQSDVGCGYQYAVDMIESVGVLVLSETSAVVEFQF